MLKLNSTAQSVVPITIPFCIIKVHFICHKNAKQGIYFGNHTTEHNMLTSSASTLGSSSHISQTLVSEPVQMSIQT